VAKQTGLGDNCYVDGNNLSGDVGSLSRISGSLNPLEVTGIDKLAYERLGGKRDGEINFTSYFNSASLHEHPVLSTLPTADRQVWYLHGTLQGAPVACMVAKQINYDPTLGTDGALTFNIQALANGFGLEWGSLITNGIQSDVTATAPATGLDQTTVSTAFGWQAYAQVFSVTGTSVTLQLKDSADNITFANLTNGAFSAVTPGGAPSGQRLVGGATDTVRRYIQVASTGTFSQASYAVVFIRNLFQSVVF
jgi:hypothetical protein